MKPFEHIVDFFIAICIMFLFVLIYFGKKQDLLTQTIVEYKTTEFVDEVRGNGYVTRERFQRYLEEIEQTGISCDISIEHSHHDCEPEYRLRTLEEVLDEQNRNYTGTNTYHYRTISTEIPTVVDPIDNSGLVINTETNESVIANAINKPASPTHIHTDACYNGVRHIHTGSSSSGGGCYGNYHSGSSCGASLMGNPERRADVLRFTCRTCWTGTAIGWHVYDVYRCSSNILAHYTSVMVSWYWECNNSACGDSYSRGANPVPSTCESTTSPYYSLNCGKIEGNYYNGNIVVSPICHQIVTSISPTHPVQTVYINEPIITTVEVTYRNGSTKTIAASANFIPNIVVQNRVVTLSYEVFTSNVVVTVIPKTKTCTNGHIYNLHIDGSDPGCPYCKAWLKSLTVYHPPGDNISIYRGTTLVENGVTLLATYMDDRTEHITTEYIDNLDMYYIGTQMVTLSYKGKYTYLSVTTMRNMIQCSICGRYYELYPDDSNPGCPDCMSKIPIFTGNVMEYTNKNYTEDILKELYEGDGIYYFNNKDYLTITVKNRSTSWGNRLFKRIYPINGDIFIHVNYGGYIREEVK